MGNVTFAHCDALQLGIEHVAIGFGFVCILAPVPDICNGLANRRDAILPKQSKIGVQVVTWVQQGFGPRMRLNGQGIILLQTLAEKAKWIRINNVWI